MRTGLGSHVGVRVIGSGRSEMSRQFWNDMMIEQFKLCFLLWISFSVLTVSWSTYWIHPFRVYTYAVGQTIFAKLSHTNIEHGQGENLKFAVVTRSCQEIYQGPLIQSSFLSNSPTHSCTSHSPSSNSSTLRHARILQRYLPITTRRASLKQATQKSKDSDESQRLKVTQPRFSPGIQSSYPISPALFDQLKS